MSETPWTSNQGKEPKIGDREIDIQLFNGDIYPRARVADFYWGFDEKRCTRICQIERWRFR
jgi:hypothetical protein